MFYSKFHVLNTVHWYKDIISNLYFKTQHFLCQTFIYSPPPLLKAFKTFYHIYYRVMNTPYVGDSLEGWRKDENFNQCSPEAQTSRK